MTKRMYHRHSPRPERVDEDGSRSGSVVRVGDVDKPSSYGRLCSNQHRDTGITSLRWSDDLTLSKHIIIARGLVLGEHVVDAAISKVAIGQILSRVARVYTVEIGIARGHGKGTVVDQGR
jgi:hypothetical protein